MLTKASITALLAVVLFAAMGLAPLRAQDDEIGTGQGQSYLPLYPAGDTYQVQVIGDWMAEGLKYGLGEAFRGDIRVAIRPRQLDLPDLMRGDFESQLKSFDDSLAKDPPHVAVVMLGQQERTTYRSGGKRFAFDSEEWQAEFGRQVDAVMKAMRRRKLAVYWVSLPNVRRYETNEDNQALNEIIREKVVLNGLRFIDVYAGFTDEGGGYSAMGPDLTGKIRLLREQNGISFTEAGNRKLGHFVERDLKRDLSQARRDRAIPLAGTESEQATIAALRQSQQKASRPAAASATQATPAAGGQVAVPAAPSDQKADSGRISIAVPAAGGKEEIVTVDLLRPAIPQTVIDLVNKKGIAEKPTTLGDLLVDKIPGGVIVMSAISPAAETAVSRARLAPTQTPYFRVMVKGERMPVKAERSDDVAWPRPEPPPVEVQAPKPPPPAVVTPPSAGIKPATPGKDAPKPKRAEGSRADGEAVRNR